MQRASSILLISGLAALALAASARSQTRDLTPLVSVHARFVFHLVKTDLYDENLFIAADGTSSANLSVMPSTSFWMADTASAKGSAGHIATLRRALGAAHVGLQTDCTIATHNSWSGTYEITWYGQNGRRIDFVVTLRYAPGAERLCPVSVKDLVNAIETYAFDVLGDAVLPELH